MNQLIPAEFHGTQLNIIDHAGRRWLTAEQVGLALGYNEANAGQGIRNLHNRHADEFTETDTGEINLISPGGRQNVRCFTSSGCIKLGFFANTGRAKEFRAWAAKVLDGQTPVVVAATPVEARLDNLESAMLQLVAYTAQQSVAMAAQAENVGVLVDVALQQAQKLDVVSRYIGLLEINQKGKVRVTRQVEAHVLALFAGGMAQSAIAYNMRLSAASVSLIVHGKYPFSGAEADKPREELGEVIERMVAEEREALYARADDMNARRIKNRELLQQMNAGTKGGAA